MRPEYKKKVTENWTDIETILLSEISSNGKESEKLLDGHGLLALKLAGLNPYIPNIESEVSVKLVLLAKVLLKILKERYEYKDRELPSNIKIVDYLIKELGVIESEFSNYLKNNLKENEADYLEKSTVLLKKLTDDKMSYIMDFNYTNPFKNQSDIIGVNVHGSLEDDSAIFGINASQIGKFAKLGELHEESLMNNHYIRPFTKSYRTLFLEDKTAFYNTSVSTIKFYGHSLGESDYNYFKIMFDSLDLFNGNLKLEFWYSTDYAKDQEEKEMIKSKYIEAVFLLLMRYEQGIKVSESDGYIFDKLRNQGRLKFVEYKD